MAREPGSLLPPPLDPRVLVRGVDPLLSNKFLFHSAISGIFFNRNFTLIIVWSKLRFHLSVTENLQTQWNELEGPPKRKFYNFRIF